jgi:hypothetical protein
MAAPRNSVSTVMGRVTPRMVRSPSTCHWFSRSPGRTAVLRKVMVGCSSLPKKSFDRRWASRLGSRVSTVEVSISTSSVESSGRSAMWATPLTSEKRPRTLDIRWRATNSNDACDGSISQSPGSGTCRPSTTRLPGVVTVSLMLVSSLRTGGSTTTTSAATSMRT